MTNPGTGGSLLVVYWFVSVYTQIVLVLALVAAVGPLRRVLAKTPWRASAVAVAGSLAVLAVLALLQHRSGGDGLPYVPQRGLPECLSVFVIGWMIQSMKGTRQVVVTVLITAAVLTLLTRLDMTLNVLVLVCVALAVLALNVPLRVRRGWARALNQLAAMTLYVYLAHQFVIHFLSRYELPQAVAALVASVRLDCRCRGDGKWAFDAVDGARFGYRSRRPTGVAPSAAVL